MIIKVQKPETIETSSVSFSDAPKPEAFLLHALTFSTFSAPRMNAKKAAKATHAHGTKVRLLSPNHPGDTLPPPSVIPRRIEHRGTSSTDGVKVRFLCRGDNNTRISGLSVNVRQYN